MRDDAVSTTLGAALMLGIVVVLAVSAAMVMSAPKSEEELESSGRARVIGDDHRVTLTGPDDIPLDEGWIDAQTASGTARIPLTDLAAYTADGTHWRVGEAVCITGTSADCALGPEDHTKVDVYAGNQWVFGLSLGDSGNLGGSQGGAAAPPIETCFEILGSGAVGTLCDLDWTTTVVGSEITMGSGGATIPTYLSYRPNASVGYTAAFGGASTGAGESEYVGELPAGSEIGLLGQAKLGSFDKEYASDSGDPHVIVLRDGDPVPEHAGYDGQVPIGTILEPYTEDGKIAIGLNEVIVLFEFVDDLTSPAADYQDLVVLLQAQTIYA